MTEGHRNRGKDLTQHIEGRHDKDRVTEALPIADKAVGPELIEGYDDKYDDGPRHCRRDITGRRKDADKRSHAARDRQREYGRDEGNIGHELFTHILTHEVLGGHDQLFCHSLAFRDIADLKAAGQPNAQTGEHRHHRPCDDKGLGDRYAAEDGDVEQYFCTGNRYIHYSFPPFFLSSFLKSGSTRMVSRGKKRLMTAMIQLMRGSMTATTTIRAVRARRRL